jgi:hypothetical protein
MKSKQGDNVVQNSGKKNAGRPERRRSDQQWDSTQVIAVLTLAIKKKKKKWDCKAVISNELFYWKCCFQRVLHTTVLLCWFTNFVGAFLLKLYCHNIWTYFVSGVGVEAKKGGKKWCVGVNSPPVWQAQVPGITW